MNLKDPKTTLRLEPALRELARNPAVQISSLAARHNVDRIAISLWLSEFNKGQRVLTAKTIDAVKQELGGITVKAAPAGLAKSTATGPDSDLNAWLAAQKADVKGRVTSILVNVTPALTQAWMKLNTANRKPSKAKIRRFSAAMKSGRWVQNGETIKFSATGRLIDGQSRLLSLIEAAVPVILEIRGGLPDQAQQSMDSGELRTGKHTLEMLGEKYPQVLAPALKLVYLDQTGRLGGNKFGDTAKLENGQLAPLLAQHPDLKSSVGWVMTRGEKLDRMVTPSLAAFFHYRFSCLAKARDSFFEALADGLGLTKVSPVYHLRERLLSDSAERISRSRTRTHRALFIKAWNAHCSNARISSLAFEDREGFPQIFDGRKAAA